MHSEFGEHFNTVSIVGAGGQTGEFFARTLKGVTRVEAIVRESQVSGFASRNLVLFRTNPDVITSEAIILATRNPVRQNLEEIREKAKPPYTVILPQNGAEAADQAKEVFAGLERKVNIIRAALVTTVGRSEESGDLIYNPGKKRIGLAEVPLTEHSSLSDNSNLMRARRMFRAAGFEVAVLGDYKTLELAKIYLNLFGLTTAATGMSLTETFLDPDIFELERRAVRDRMEILDAAGIPFEDLPWTRQLSPLTEVPNTSPTRALVAGKVGNERFNLPSAAAVQIFTKDEKQVEAEKYYLKAFIDFGKQIGLRSPVDEAVYEILKRHRLEYGLEGGFNLRDLGAEDRKRLLLDVADRESRSLFIESSPIVTAAAEGLTRVFSTESKKSGKENIQAMLDCLRDGGSVILAPNHLSHIDHLALVMALKEFMGKEFYEYGFAIVAGLLFEKEKLAKIFSKGYPQIIVDTLKKNPTSEEEWKAQLLNKRSKDVSTGFLNKPSMLVVYFEGSRSRTGELQEAAPGASGYLLHKNVRLAVPVGISGTQSILPPHKEGEGGFQLPTFGSTNLVIGQGIETAVLIAEAQQYPKNERDSYISRRIQEATAELLPEDQRGIFRSAIAA